MHPEIGEAAVGIDMTATIAQLQRDPGALPWPERRVLVKTAAEQLERGGQSDLLVSLLFLLAGDPKWEVRKDVADCLLMVGDDEFPQLAARLGQDDNAFVRQAAQRAMDRRRRGQESVQRKRRGLDHVQDQYDRMVQNHGSLAAGQAHAMAERLYDVLVGATVHDMRNILAPLKSAIRSLLGHLGEGQIDAALFTRKLKKMNGQAEMTERMLEDMRTYSQPTPTQRRRERLADLLREAYAVVADTFRATGRDASCVSVEMDVPENLTVDVARHDIVRALINLKKNACESHASGPKTFSAGSVWVKARLCDADRVEIIFRDDGMGLSAEELNEVRRFVPGGTSKKTYGTGFGLPTAKRKIEAHGGLLSIDSKENEGTTVIVTLPVEAGGDE